MLNHEIKQDVKAYMSCITHDTLTVLELLDIKEFEKSHKLNGDLLHLLVASFSRSSCLNLTGMDMTM